MFIPRSSGVLLHISSLYTPYGIGDFGPSAHSFVDFLNRSGIYFWQTLPLNYTDAGRGYSPYSCLSAFAGNPLFISPDLLVKEGLLAANELTSVEFPEDRVDFDAVYTYKTDLLERAFERFKKEEKDAHFESFCKKNNYWLDDFSLFISIKKHYNNAWWLDWPEDLQNRNASALQKRAEALSESIVKEKFFQYLFFKQLNELRDYARKKNVRFIGDMPFYISHDSSDVWVYPSYFKLDKNKKPIKVSGVPPDLFCETGQLWGMPVYQWEMMKQEDYSWWIERIKQTLKMCDIIRLDHFRAFSAYWEIDATEQTAEKGVWMKGPGKDFFHVLLDHLHELPFIAEDLGDVDQPVWDIMDEFHIPGMKILQFAFTEYTPESIHSPHHHVPFGVVYTGTHDNNTLRGWYENEVTDEKKKLISLYFNKEVTKVSCTQDFIRAAIASVSQVAIWPMQDLLDLGQEARMNFPSTLHGNWSWRLSSQPLSEDLLSKEILQQLALFDRLVPE